MRPADLRVVIDELVVPAAVDRDALAAAIGAELGRLGAGGATGDVGDLRLRLPITHPDLSEVTSLATAIALAIHRGTGG